MNLPRRRSFGAILFFCCAVHSLSGVTDRRTTGYVTAMLGAPQVGLGTGWLRGDDAYSTTLRALRIGYRMIDTAADYENEDKIGAALRDSKIPRSEIFLISKCCVRACSLSAEQAERQLRESLRALGVTYLDLYLIHVPGEIGRGDEIITNAIRSGSNFSQLCRVKSVDYENTNTLRRAQVWNALNMLKQAGLVRHIGVSNFGWSHLQELCTSKHGCPSVNQIEWHPLWHDEQLKSEMDKWGIVTMAYAPTGRNTASAENAELASLARELNTSVADLSLRWSIGRGVVVIPRASTETHLRSNLMSSNRPLTASQMEIIDAVPSSRQNCKYCADFPNMD